MFPDRINFLGYRQDILDAVLNSISGAEEEPGCDYLTDVIAIPGFEALYQSSGERIDYTNRAVFTPNPGISELSLQASIKKEFRFSPERIEPPKDIHIVDTEVYYAGTLFNHYGHFLTDSMARLWCYDGLLARIPMVFLPHHENPLHVPYISATLSALGITDCSVVSQPTRFRRVIAPRPAMEHSFKIYRAMDRPHVIAAARLRRKRLNEGRPIYLSRAGLIGGRTFPIDIATEIEVHVKRHGFLVVRPELLSLEEQISLFTSSPMILGELGSAFHTALFCDTGFRGTLIYLTWHKPYWRFLLTDLLKEYRATYANVMTTKIVGRRLQIAEVNLDKIKDLVTG